MTWLPSSSLTSAFRGPAHLSPTSARRVLRLRLLRGGGLQLGLLGRRGGPGSSAVAASADSLLLLLRDGLGGASDRGGLSIAAFAAPAVLAAVAVAWGGPGAALLVDRACRLSALYFFFVGGGSCGGLGGAA